MERGNSRRKIEELIMEGIRKRSRSNNSTSTSTNTDTAIIQTRRWLPANKTNIEGIRKYLRD